MASTRTRRTIALSVTITTLLVTMNAAKAALTNEVNRTIEYGSVVGTLETTGNLGVLIPSDLTGWTLTLTLLGTTRTLLKSESELVWSGAPLRATMAGIVFEPHAPSATVSQHEFQIREKADTRQ